LLNLAQIPKSTYYDTIKRWATSKESADKWLLEKIKTIYARHKGRYGYRRITLALNSDAEVIEKYGVINHKRTHRLMKAEGLKAKIRFRKYRSYRGQSGKIAANLLNRDFNSNFIEKKMVTDVTEFRVCNQKIYLSPLIDLCTKEVISYSISKSPTVSFVLEMLEKGLKKETYKDLTIHSDQGFQYQNIRFSDWLKKRKIKQSMSRKGNCFDNSLAENFFSQLKAEFFHVNQFKSVDEFIVGIKEYISYYNNERIVSKLKMAPIQYRNQLLISN